MRWAALALTIALAGCGGDSDSDNAEPRPVCEWDIGPVVNGRNYSVGLPRCAEPGPVIRLGPGKEPHYVTRAADGLDRSATIRLRYRIDGPPETVFTPCATVSLYLQRRGDRWSGDGYRWWASFAARQLALGEHEMEAPLDGAWTGTLTYTAATHPEEFAAALREAGRVGFTFGNCTGAGHGASASHDVVFTVTEFTIQ